MGWLAVAALVLGSTLGAGAGPVRLVTDCEDLTGWQRQATLTEDAAEGRSAVAIDLPAEKLSFVQFDLNAVNTVVSDAQTLTFQWKVNGPGLKRFMVKVRDYPLVDGMEAVYLVWDAAAAAESAPTKWTRAYLELPHPLYDNWGGSPVRDRHYLSFRAETEAGVRLFIDDVRTIPPLLDWDLAVTEPEEGDGSWQADFVVRSLVDEALPIRLFAQDKMIAEVSLAPKQEHRGRALLAPSPETSGHLKPKRFRFCLEAETEPVVRLERTVAVFAPLDLPPHPRLLLDGKGLDALKTRIEQQTWAKADWEALLARADAMGAKPVELPPRGGNWWHWYACPTHGAGLQTGKQLGPWEWEHVCPIDKEVLLGDPNDPSRDYDGCTINGFHSEYARGVRDLGLAYAVTGEDRYAAKAREILLAYADRYLDYPLHTIRGEPKIGGGRVGPQSLDESVWLIPFAQGADLVWDTLDEEAREQLANGILLPAARDVILAHKMGVHNIQCWKNSAVGLVGLLLGDAELVYEAIENPDRGYRRQMADGVRPDGAWWEGAWGYHFYTLSALWPLVEAARNCGTDLYGDAYKRMYDAPLQLAMPNLHLPAFNDSGEVDLGGRRAQYELAYARYGDPAYVALLRSGERNSDFALWYGVATLPEAARMAWTSADHPGSGYAILARGEGKAATWLCLKYGPHGGGHGHPDKLNFVLYGKGKVIAVDPGTARYGLPIQKTWYRTTFAHNTLVVDKQSQAQSEGKLLAFGREGDIEYAMAEAGPIYEGVRFVRTVAMLSQDLVVFVDQVHCNEPHQLDLVYHQRGTWQDLPDGEPWPVPEALGYQHLRDATARNTDQTMTLTTEVDTDFPVAVTLAGGTETQVITATGFGGHVEDRVPVTVFRRTAKDTAYVSCVSLDGTPVELDVQAAAEPSALDVRVQDNTGRTWEFSVGTADGQGVVRTPELGMRFPGSESETALPGGQYVLVNVDEPSQVDANHVLMLRNVATGEEVPLHAYGRYVDVHVSPNGSRIAITDHVGSDSSNVLVYTLAPELSKVDIGGQLPKHDVANRLAAENHHAYITVDQWLNEDSVGFRLWGYGAEPGGFEMRCVFDLARREFIKGEQGAEAP